MEQNLISVIMPVYKTEESHLRKAIESVINQSYRELEIVLVDDGSPDQCGAICDTYAETDNRVRVIHKKNGGVSSARNCGLETVTGDYIFFVDSDDTLEKNAIEILFSITKTANSDITICSCRHNEYTFLPLMFAKTVIKFEKPLYCYRLGREGQSVSIEGVKKHYRDAFSVAEKMYKAYEDNKEITGEIDAIAQKKLCYITDTVYTYCLVVSPNREMKIKLKEYEKNAGRM